MNRHLTHAITVVAAVAAVAFTWSWAQSAPNVGARIIPYQGYLEINGQPATPTSPPWIASGRARRKHWHWRIPSGD